MRLLAPLRVRPVALLWGGLALSAIGDQLYIVALTWVAVGVFGAAAGYLSALQAAVVLATALLAGSRADRWDQRHAMIAADLARAAVLLLVVIAWTARGAPSAWTLIAAVTILAAGRAIFQPGLQVLLPDLLPDHALLPASNALLDSTERIARLLGPGLVALLGAALPVAGFFLLDAASFLISAIAIALIGSIAARPLADPHESVLAQIRRGFAALRAHRVLGFTLMTAGAVNGAWYAVYFLGLPLLLEQRGITGPAGSGIGAYGLVIAAYGCTNFLAMLVVGNRALSARPATQIFSGNAIVGAGIVLLGLAAAAKLPQAWQLAAFAGCAALSAIGGPLNDIPVAVLRQTQLRRSDVAAAMRAFLVMNNGGLLIGLLIAPRAFETLGIPATILLCGGLIVTLGAAGILRFRGAAPQLNAAPP